MQFSKLNTLILGVSLFFLFILSLEIVFYLNIIWGWNYFGILFYAPMLFISFLKRWNFLRFSYGQHKKILAAYLFWGVFIVYLSIVRINPEKMPQFLFFSVFCHSIFISLLAGNQKYRSDDSSFSE